jgi:hypothetical protein
MLYPLSYKRWDACKPATSPLYRNWPVPENPLNYNGCLDLITVESKELFENAVKSIPFLAARSPWAQARSRNQNK